MLNKKRLFTKITTLALGAIVGTTLAFNPVNASADHHEQDKEQKEGEHSCGGEGKCSGEKKKEKEGEHSCGGSGKCSSNK